MKEGTKNNLIVLVPLVVLLVLVGSITNYNLIATAVAGAIGGLIGRGILALKNKKRTNV
ncbi:hypothetical protein J4423_02240 [Candidatus Pacearchaeota archaeon]|nr:hypothetical protein [Candidatus Pacearchaeota archaeon]